MLTEKFESLVIAVRRCRIVAPARSGVIGAWTTSRSNEISCNADELMTTMPASRRIDVGSSLAEDEPSRYPCERDAL